MSYGHAAALLPRCAAAPDCTRPGLIVDDTTGALVCARHALTTAQETHT